MDLSGISLDQISMKLSIIKIYDLIVDPMLSWGDGQGCFGAVPFSALSFLNMWVQSLGFDTLTAAWIYTVGEFGGIPGTN